MKRMATIFAHYEEQKPDLSQQEKEERNTVIKLLKEALRLLRDDFQEQTKQFGKGGGAAYPRGGQWTGNGEDPMMTMMTDVSNTGFGINNDRNGIKEMGNNPNDNIMLNRKADDKQNNRQAQYKVHEHSFDANCFEAQKRLESLEKKHLNMDGQTDEAVRWHLGDNMTHSYYLDTVTNIRSTRKCFCDIIMIVLMICFVVQGLFELRSKDLIKNYHAPWVKDMTSEFNVQDASANLR